MLEVFTQQQRRELDYYGMRRDVLPGIVRHVDEIGSSSWIIFSDLDESDADAVIDEQVAYFRELGHAFEWKVYDGDKPPDLRDRLRQRGFSIGSAEATLVLSLADAPDVLLQPPAADIRPVMEPDEILRVLTIQSRVFGGDLESVPAKNADDDGFWLGFEGKLIKEVQEAPDQIGIYAAYVDDVPVSSAWIRYPPRNAFASLWGGSTLKPYRQRGLYTALLAVRTQAAKDKGRRYLTVDASPMSSPILQKVGFQIISQSYPCQWEPPRKS